MVNLQERQPILGSLVDKGENHSEGSDHEGSKMSGSEEEEDQENSDKESWETGDQPRPKRKIRPTWRKKESYGLIAKKATPAKKKPAKGCPLCSPVYSLRGVFHCNVHY